MIEYENLCASNSTFAKDIEIALKRVLESGWYILGKEVEYFEQEFAKFTGVDHCIGVANGLDALTLSLRALELPADSEVLVASNTYIATILAIIQAGLKPVLVEPDIDTYNIDPSLFGDVFTNKTRAICITHLYGKSCNMDEIMHFAKEHSLHIIEDCAQSHGAMVNGKMTGSFGIAGCFSFYPTKNLGALGDAGAITTNDTDYADRLRHWRNYGSKQKYINIYPGVNSRLDELQAAVLRVKLPDLNKITAHKRELAQIYINNLPEGITLPVVDENYFDVFHIFPIRYLKRDELRKFLLDQGIKTEVHYPVAPHRQQAMIGILGGEYPVADLIHRTELSLPISYSTTADEVMAVCSAITKFVAEN